MAYAYAGPTNAYIPTLELSGNLQIKFSRNRDSYALNKWTRWRNVKATNGLYRHFNPLDVNRIKSGNTRQFDWAPGTLSPIGTDSTIGFENRQYNCIRRAYACDVDLLTVQQADFDLIADAADNAASLAMVVRTVEAISVVTTSGNHESSHVATATTAGGGVLSGGTATDPRIKKALQYFTLRIVRDSNGNIKPSDIAVVMNPNTAQLLSQTAEVHQIFANSLFASDLLQGGVKNLNATWGLPPFLYDHPVIVEDATYNAYERDNLTAPEAQAYAFPDNYIALVTVQGDGENKGLPAASTNKSSMTFFVYGPDDMKVETKIEEYDRIHRMKVVDNFEVKLTAPVTAALMTNVFS